ncbi:MAG: hypothetical protein LUC43_09970 [Burkholderiales bacterium]|nr:hypothetical protein [Burkholderiales bacterium]
MEYITVAQEYFTSLPTFHASLLGALFLVFIIGILIWFRYFARVSDWLGVLVTLGLVAVAMLGVYLSSISPSNDDYIESIKVLDYCCEPGTSGKLNCVPCEDIKGAASSSAASTPATGKATATPAPSQAPTTPAPTKEATSPAPSAPVTTPVPSQETTSSTPSAPATTAPTSAETNK